MWKEMKWHKKLNETILNQGTQKIICEKKWNDKKQNWNYPKPRGKMWKEMKWHHKIKWNYPKPKEPKKLKCEKKWNDTKI